MNDMTAKARAHVEKLNNAMSAARKVTGAEGARARYDAGSPAAKRAMKDLLQAAATLEQAMAAVDADVEGALALALILGKNAEAKAS